MDSGAKAVKLAPARINSNGETSRCICVPSAIWRPRWRSRPSWRCRPSPRRRDTLVQAWQIDDIISLDPAEIFEISSTEIAGNTYERLIGYDIHDVSKVFGVVAETWTVSEDGKTITFKIREGRKFASGNPITAADASSRCSARSSSTSRPPSSSPSSA